MRNCVTKKITEFADREKSAFLIAGDAGYGVLDEYQRRFPDRYLNLGVAEQNAISFAAGLSLSGYKVFVYNIVPFVLYRCYEQVRNDICYQKLPVTLIGIGSGVTYAPGGMTHYSVEDIAVAKSLPGLVIISPSDPEESKKAIEFSFTSEKPVYIRIPKSGELTIHKKPIKDITKPQVTREGKGVAVLFHGSISQEMISLLEDKDRDFLALSIPMIQPLDFKSLFKMLDGIHTVITVEEHFVEGGLGTIIAEWIIKEALPFKLTKLGIKNEFLHEVKNTKGMRKHYGISSLQIKEAILEGFKNA